MHGPCHYTSHRGYTALATVLLPSVNPASAKSLGFQPKNDRDLARVPIFFSDISEASPRHNADHPAPRSKVHNDGICRIEIFGRSPPCRTVPPLFVGRCRSAPSESVRQKRISGSAIEVRLGLEAGDLNAHARLELARILRQLVVPSHGFFNKVMDRYVSLVFGPRTPSGSGVCEPYEKKGKHNGPWLYKKKCAYSGSSSHRAMGVFV